MDENVRQARFLFRATSLGGSGFAALNRIDFGSLEAPQADELATT
ncbi:MAG: hypothetical protein ABIP55_05455 [Tepidisphaeraceae bacterium]